MLQALALATVLRTAAAIGLNPQLTLLLLQSVNSTLALDIAALFMPVSVLFYVLCCVLLAVPAVNHTPTSLLSAQINTLYFEVPFASTDRMVFLRCALFVCTLVGVDLALLGLRYTTFILAPIVCPLPASPLSLIMSLSVRRCC